MTARDRCFAAGAARLIASRSSSLAEVILKEVISEMLQASAANAIRFIITLVAWQCNPMATGEATTVRLQKVCFHCCSATPLP